MGTSFHIVISTKVWFFWWLNDVPLFHVLFENLNRAMIVISSRSENGASLKKLILIRLKSWLNRTGHQVKPQTPKWRVTESMARYWSYFSKALQWRRLIWAKHSQAGRLTPIKQTNNFTEKSQLLELPKIGSWIRPKFGIEVRRRFLVARFELNSSPNFYWRDICIYK